VLSQEGLNTLLNNDSNYKCRQDNERILTNYLLDSLSPKAPSELISINDTKKHIQIVAEALNQDVEKHAGIIFFIIRISTWTILLGLLMRYVEMILSSL
jgi:hypothetical protein